MAEEPTGLFGVTNRLRSLVDDPLSRPLRIVLVSLILIAAAWFRLYQIDQAPPGPHYDEAAAALDALDVLGGQHMVFSPRSYGREMLFVYVATPLVALLGPTRLALRLPTAMVGVLTVLCVYFLALELLNHEDERRSRWIAILSSLFLALSFWHVVLNRIGFRANYLPLVEVLCFLFLFRALRRGRPRDFALSGFFLGLSLYTYSAARLVPVVVVLFLATLLLAPRSREFSLSHWQGWVLLGVVALLVSVPLLIHFAMYPEDLVLRAKGVSIFSEHLHQGRFWDLLARSVAGNLALFGLRGDPDWTYNIPGRPGLDPVQAVLFWMGLVLCLVRWRRPAYRFLAIWWLIMLLPSILAPDPIPHSLRAIGTLPVACILAACALTWILSHLAQRTGWQRVWDSVRGSGISNPRETVRTSDRLVRLVPMVLLVGLASYLVWTGHNTWHSYFDVWLPRDEVYHTYYGHMADLAERINQDTDTEGVYVVPLNYDLRGEDYSEYSLELMHHGPVPFRYIVVDDATVAHDLTEICDGKRWVHLIVWTHGNHVDADPRQVLPFFLERSGREAERESFRGYEIISYELLSTAVDFSAPLDFVATEAMFSGGLGLVAQTHETTTPSGETAALALGWQAEQASALDEPPAHDWKASVRLLDSGGHLVGQSDAWLLSNEHRMSSQWEPGQPITTYHLLPILPATPPGTGQLLLILYDPDTLEPAQVVTTGDASAQTSLSLGSLEISRPMLPVAVEPEVPLPSVAVAPGVELVGYGMDRLVALPGETVRLALYWHARTDISDEYEVIMQLIDERGKVAAEWIEEPIYSTSKWQTGDVWRDWHDLGITRDIPGGEYQLGIHMRAAEPTGLPQVELGRLEVQERALSFQVPSIEHRVAAQLGQEIQFLGYDLRQEQVLAGDVLDLTLYWRALTKGDVSYTVFTHLLDRDSQIWGQVDSLPGAGALPTTLWVPDEIIVDHYEIPVDTDAPQGEYRVEIGMYDAATSQRLPILDDSGHALGDHLLLDTTIAVTR